MASQLNLRLTIASVVLLVGGACSSSKTLQPCPPNGLGTEGTREEVEEQLRNWDDYNCSEPQICIDLPFKVIPNHVIGSSPTEANFLIKNCSTGKQNLEINKVVLYGDWNCSFGEPELEGNTIAPGESVSLRVLYDPDEASESQARIGIFSNAQNYTQPFEFPICGRAVTTDQISNPGTDGGVGNADGGDLFECVFIDSEVNTACHQD